MGFSQHLWHQIDSVYQQILKHPFVTELMDGSLSRDVFQHYIFQDALYLHDFGRALAMLAARSPDSGKVQSFLNFAHEAVVVEQSLHDQYLGGSAADSTSSVKSAVCTAYTSYLLNKTAYGAYETGVAAVLPCFWIYREVGHYIYQNTQRDNPYQSWIDAYASEEFSALVEEALAITNQLAGQVSPSDRQAMADAFLKASRFEWMFWDSAYYLRGWPV